MFKGERQLKSASEAWRQGCLENAIAMLRALQAKGWDGWETALPLARALAEHGEAAEGLAVLDAAESRRGACEAAATFRGLIHYDCADYDAMQTSLAPLFQRNVLADALCALRSEEERDEPAEFPDGAVWLSDVAGRLLALREERLYASAREEADRFHHGLLIAPTPAPEGVGRLDRYDDPSSWAAALEAAYQAGDFGEVVRVYTHKTADSDWRDDEATALYAFALLATDNESRVEEILSRRLQDHPQSSDLHFLRGLAYSRRGKRVEAGWCFARASRLADTDLFYVLDGVTRTLSTVAERA